MWKPLVLSLALAGLAGCGGVVARSQLRAGPPVAAHFHAVCLVQSELLPASIKYTVLGTINATKRTYGSVTELNAAIATEARHIGADAVLGYHASQRFKGPLPWRLTSPSGVGTAVKLTEGTLDCGSVQGLSL